MGGETEGPPGYVKSHVSVGDLRLSVRFVCTRGKNGFTGNDERRP